MILEISHNVIPDTRDLIARSTFSGDPEAEEILRECLWRSEDVQYGILDGRVACVWGLIPPTLLSECAYLWLLTTDIVVEHKFLFVRNAQIYVEDMLKRYPILYGDVGDPRAVKWLKWLGAVIGEPIDGRIPFMIRRD